MAPAVPALLVDSRGRDVGVKLSKSQKKKSRMKRNAILKSKTLTEQLHGFLIHGEPHSHEFAPSLHSTLVSQLCRIERKLDLLLNSQPIHCQKSIYDGAIAGELLASQCAAARCIQGAWKKRYAKLHEAAKAIQRRVRGVITRTHVAFRNQAQCLEDDPELSETDTAVDPPETCSTQMKMECCKKCLLQVGHCICWNIFCRSCIKTAENCCCDNPCYRRRQCSHCHIKESDSFTLFDAVSIIADPLPRVFACHICGKSEFEQANYYRVESAKTCLVCKKLGYYGMVCCDNEQCAESQPMHQSCMNQVGDKFFCNVCSQSHSETHIRETLPAFEDGWPDMDEHEQRDFQDWYRLQRQLMLQECRDPDAVVARFRQMETMRWEAWRFRRRASDK